MRHFPLTYVTVFMKSLILRGKILKKKKKMLKILEIFVNFQNFENPR